ncbi:MAG: hypothetical protein ACETVY_03120 [Candidatus Bathyarchaeia archaeon]
MGTCIGALIGLLLGFLIGELAWSTIICTAVGSILGQAKDSRTTVFESMQSTTLDD